MKLNQFALVPRTPAEEIKEMLAIQFISENDLKLPSHQMLHLLLQRCFPETTNDLSADDKLANLLADTDTDALTLVEQKVPLRSQHLLNLYLQLLGFQPELDFDLKHPEKIQSELNLPLMSDPVDRSALLHVWYQLLITHTTTGQTFLDQLASRGYFRTRPNLAKPLFFNGKAQPVFDTNKLIHEVVYVESPQDTDHDGQRDLLKVEVVRPSESSQQPVPTLYTASPYNQGTNDKTGEALTHNVNVPLTEKQPLATTLSGQPVTAQNVPAPRPILGTANSAAETMGNTFDYSLNDYFLARGFAVVYAAGIGTKESDGLRTTGDPEETTSTIAVIEWLAGNRTAFTDRRNQIAIDATWSNHLVAMTGRSYLGTLATAAATTGVEGLKTIICEAGISSWYDYYRENGLVIAPGGFQGEDADVLAEETFSRELQAGDYHRIKPKWQAQLKQISQGQDRQTGNYNDFWHARNYRQHADHIKADVMIIHGLNDWNVKPRNAEKLWRKLEQLPITKKLILHQGPHIYINNFRSLDFTDMVNLWLSHELYGIDNQADTILPNVVIQDNTTPETWHRFDNWGASSNPVKHYYLNDTGLDTHPSQTATQQFSDKLSSSQFAAYIKSPEQWQHDLVRADSPMTGHRLLYPLPQQTEDLILDGCPIVNLSLATDQSIGMISAQLADLGSFKRLQRLPTTLEGQAMDYGFHYRKEALRDYQLSEHATDFQLITKGHMNLQNRRSLTQVDAITPNEFYQVQIECQPTHYRLTKGHQLALIIYATDMGMTIHGNQDITYSVQLAKSAVEVPTLSR